MNTMERNHLDFTPKGHKSEPFVLFIVILLRLSESSKVTQFTLQNKEINKSLNQLQN